MVLKKRNIKFCTILTTGRTGSDYLENCLNNVPGILTLPDKIFYYNFCKKINFGKKSTLNTIDILNKFIEHKKNLFFGNKFENKIFKINIKKFTKIFLKIYKNKKISRKNFLLHIYLSFEKYLNLKQNKKLLIIYHAHKKYENDQFMEDFKNSKTIITIRDPRENLCSGIFHWRKFDKKFDNQMHNYYYLKRIIADLNYSFKIKNKKKYVKLETLGNKKVKRDILNFLNIKYNKNILFASYLGKKWIGDNMSSFKSKNGGFNNSIRKFKFKYKLSEFDIMRLDTLYQNYRRFNYNIKKNNLIKKLFVLSTFFFPFSYENKIFTLNYYKSNDYSLIKNIYFYVLRSIFLFNQTLKSVI